MVKIIVIPILCSLTTGCSWFCKDTIDINTDVKEQFVEVMYCPAPADVARPDLPLQSMTPEQEASDGEVAKHWKATLKALLGYTKELETVVDNQKEINKAYEDKKLEMEISEPTTE